MPLTREEYIKEYGFDPEGGTETAPSTEATSRPLTSIATGIASIPTDLYSLPSVVTSGVSALYRSYKNDSKFLEEFAKDMQVDDATKNIQDHFNTVAQTWKQRDPSLTDEDINAGIANYKKSKEFEDFQMEQLRHGPYVAAKAKDSIRKMLGDNRTDDQRSWTDSAMEVLGGSVVGGPGGWATGAASAGARAGGIAAKVTASPLTRGALKTAEVLTPATVPYTPLNIAANATIGLGVDQGLRYAQGKSTPFTPTPDDSASIGTMAAMGAGVAGVVAFVSAVKGRSAAALHAASQNPSGTTQAIHADPALNDRISDPVIPGQALIEGGVVAQRGPTPQLSMLDNIEAATMDSTAALTRGHQIARKGDPQVYDLVNRLEAATMSGSAAVSRDSVPPRVDAILQGPEDVLKLMSPEERRSATTGHWMTSNDAQNQIKYEAAQALEFNLKQSIANTNTSPQQRAADQRKLLDVQQRMADYNADLPHSRPRLPDVTTASGEKIAQAFTSDTSPLMVKYREAVKRANREMLDIQVAAGEVSARNADEMHARNPYYVQSIDDPLEGTTGAARVWKAASRAVDRMFSRGSEGTGTRALHEGPLRHLDKDLPSRPTPGSPETRITMPMDSGHSMRVYAERVIRSADLARARTDNILHLAWKDGLGISRVPTDFHTDGGMRIIQSPHGREWWTGEQLHGVEINAIQRQPNVVAVKQGGNVQLWEMGDIAIAQALRNEPVLLSSGMKFVSATSNIMKAFTTGVFNPAFAPIGAMYNTIIGIMTRPAGRAFGHASYMAMRLLPEGWAKQIVGRVPDISVPLTWPYHMIRSMIEIQTYHMTQPIVRELLKNTAFTSLQQAVGHQQFSTMVNTMLRVASWAEQSPAVLLKKAGATTGHQTIDNLPSVRKAFEQASAKMPAPLRAAWQFYKDGLDAIYLADKRMYFTQNYALQDIKYGRRGLPVPQHEIDRIVGETRVLAGDMAKVAGSATMQNLERAFPYLTQTKLGAYHLMRHMGSAETASYVIPRSMMMTQLVAASFYMMTYWDDETRDTFWNRTPEHERWKYIYVPTPEAAIAFASGSKLPGKRENYYRVPVPPDIAPMVASAVAFMQMLGAIPADATPRPIASDLGRTLVDSFTPAMPPLAQAVLAMSNMKLDPQSSETRGGDWIRSIGSRFKAGPQAEAQSNLGQVTNSTSLMLNAIFGAVGAHLSVGTDIFLHAGKFKQTQPGVVTPRETFDFNAGLKAATTEVLNRMTDKVPDVPLLWQNKQKYATTTPAWSYMKEQDGHIRSINGMYDELGKAAQARQQAGASVGGMNPMTMTNPALASLAGEVKKWQNPTGELGLLKKAYSDLGNKQRALQSQYNMPQGAKKQALDDIVKQMQDNMQQQFLASKYAEELIAQKYGQVLTPLLKGRPLTFATIDQVMRESIGTPVVAASD